MSGRFLLAAHCSPLTAFVQESYSRTELRATRIRVRWEEHSTGEGGTFEFSVIVTLYVANPNLHSFANKFEMTMTEGNYPQQ